MTKQATPWITTTILLALMIFAFLPLSFALKSIQDYWLLRTIAGAEILVWILIVICAYASGFSLKFHLKTSVETRVLWGPILLVLLIGLFTVGHGILRLPLTLLLLSVTPMVFYLSTIKKSEYSECILTSFVSAFTLYCIVVLFLFVTGLYTPPFSPKPLGLFPGFNNIRHVAPPIGCAIMIGTFLYPYKNNVVDATISKTQFISLTVLWSVFLFSGTRGGLVSILIALTIICFVKRTAWKQYVPVFIAPMLTGASVAALLPSVLSIKSAHVGLLSIFFRLTEHNSVDSFSSGRLTIWKAGIRSANESPFIGHGIGNFKRTAQYLNGKDLGAHNLTIEYIHALGYVGGLCVILWVFIKWWKAALSIRGTTNYVGLAAFSGLTFLLIYSNLNSIGYRYYSLMILFLIFPIVIANTKTKRN
jgi:O-antigen ligase